MYILQRAFFWLAKALFYVKTDLFNTAEKARDILLQVRNPFPFGMIVSGAGGQGKCESPDISVGYLRKFGRPPKDCGTAESGLRGETRPSLVKYMPQREPENLDVLASLGLAYLKIGKEDEAFSTFGNALTYEPNHTRVD